ncbi:MAG: HAD family hydrolase [Haloferacaceae archaeon]
MGIRAVAFDLDYTLAVPDRDRETILSEAVEATGAPRLTREEYLAAHSDNLTEETREPVFEALLADRETDTPACDVARAYRERVTDALVPVPGVEGLLSELRGTYRLGLLTNGPTVAQREKLRVLGWTEAFDVALVSGELAAGKPDRAAFAALVEALGVEPGETVFVGDRVGDDVGGAAAAGLLPIQVLYPGGPDPDERAVAHVQREDLVARLPELLRELG